MTPIPEYEIAVRREHIRDCVLFRFRSKKDTFEIACYKHVDGIQCVVDELGVSLRKEAARIAESESGADDKTPQEIADRAEEIAHGIFEQLSQTRFRYDSLPQSQSR